MEKDSKQ
ncbi:hypothetical protein Ahy_A06g030281 isoform G [Arachis hypogaea]|nr:hypothetical protein Ahy_B06g085410 isoform G [Arachis hypogaea]RYR55031.1 hypothetical protein Ahy_A06g030281 isoform G [Arachis hypogaea]